MTLLILLAGLQAYADGFSQTVSFKGKDVPLQMVLSSFEKQTGLSFFFNFALVNNAKPVTLDLHNVRLEEALQETLKGEGLEFYRDGKTIFIVKKTATAAATSGNGLDVPSAKIINVKGKVTGQQGEALAGASVSIKNSGKGTLTDEKGNFELKSVIGDAVLEVSYTGYSNRVISLNGQEILTISLSVASNDLDEAQVIAYGATTRRYSTGNVSTVKGEDIEKQPVNNPLIALEGRVPGLFITQTTGVPGGLLKVHLQGQNSINKGNDPLYVIDGVPYTSQLLSTDLGGGILGSYAGLTGNPFSFINPADIESISVLKDADATAIYGSRAANGAILITTKKGKPGQSKVDINVQNGWGHEARKLNLLNTSQYLQMRHEALNNDGLTPDPGYDYDLTFWDTTRFTDWQKVLLGGAAKYTNANAAVSGGSSNIQYLIASTYHSESSVFPDRSDADRKGSVHFNLNSTSSNQKFKVQFSGNYLVDFNRLPDNDLSYQAVILPPDAPPLYNADGSLNWAPTSSGTSSWSNPLANLTKKFYSKTNNLLSNAILSYQLLPNLILRSSFGYTILQSTQSDLNPLVATQPENRPTTERSASFASSNINSWIVEPQASYRMFLGKGKLEALAGTTIHQKNSTGQQLVGVGYNSDQVLGDLLSASTVTVASTISSTYKYNAVFARVNYDWDNKYVLNLSARRDGSSRFGSANQFHNFESVGAAWIFSQENVFKSHIPFLSFGKVRASYGTTGNDQIGDYQYLNLYSPISAGVPYQGATGLSINSLSNPYLQWEETRKLDIGLELGFWADRIVFSGDYSRNRSSNQLLSYGLPTTTGFTSIFRNLPATVQNTSWELMLNTVNIKAKNFSWTSSINLTIPHNKLLAFQNLATSGYATSYAIGQAITIVKALHFMGVDPATGMYQFLDKSGKITTSPDYLNDQTDIINTAPKYYGGFQNSVRFKNIQLDFLFQFVKQRAGTGGNYRFGYYPGTEGLNQPTYVLSRWQKPGDIASVQRYNSDFSLYEGYSDAVASNAYYSDASYIRLRNVSLSWDLPERWVQKARLKTFGLFVLGQNLLTITNYKGADPESQSSLTLPPLRVITFGLKTSF